MSKYSQEGEFKQGRGGDPIPDKGNRTYRELLEDVSDALWGYTAIDGRIEDLRKERASLEARLMPKTGSSLVRVAAKNGTVSDPTGQAGVNLVEHPLIKGIDREIEFYRARKTNVERALEALSPEDRKRAAYLWFGDLDPVPDFGSERPSAARRRILQEVARTWEM